MPATKKAGKFWACIMAGGSGTRFWPESRQKNPKQFLRIFGSKTLLEQTLDRLGKAIPPSRIFVVTQKDKVAQTRRLLKKVPSSQVIGEPVGRNTAPCAVLAARLVLRKDPKAVLALLPADHRVKNVLSFRRALAAAAKAAEKTGLALTFGIKPQFPHTGYGYLEMRGRRGTVNGFSVYGLKRFYEKPNLQRAKKFIRSRKFLWNSGIFVWRADALLKAAARYLPRATQLAGKIQSAGLESGMRRFYKGMPNISIDYGLMEKMRGQILTVPVDFGWNDVGGWQSLAELWPKDRGRNISLGKTLLLGSEGNIVKGSKRLIALLGVKDHVVVDTPDALLICPKDKTESIRRVVQTLRGKKMEKYL